MHGKFVYVNRDLNHGIYSPGTKTGRGSADGYASITDKEVKYHQSYLYNTGHISNVPTYRTYRRTSQHANPPQYRHNINETKILSSEEFIAELKDPESDVHYLSENPEDLDIEYIEQHYSSEDD